MSPSSDATTVFEMTVTLPANLHARPAGKLAQAAARFASVIRIRHGAKSVDPKGVLAVMSLGATAGSAVTVSAEGPDAQEAVHALTEVLSNAE
jgi:phosphotransferase system HPr (HPr) family protein